jgi:hypothetical protein
MKGSANGQERLGDGKAARTCMTTPSGGQYPPPLRLYYPLYNLVLHGSSRGLVFEFPRRQTKDCVIRSIIEVQKGLIKVHELGLRPASCAILFKRMGGGVVVDSVQGNIWYTSFSRHRGIIESRKEGSPTSCVALRRGRLAKIPGSATCSRE